ncbi:MAG: DUF3551 domain-containing protein [Bradyrhizobium sp.]|uniref:DUF3551 domain-containing protein n=1 Tax=Bradyrhizobium sp. TaxID=376 RepID=UPI0025C4C60B|nr:DUF3551 domain-containing protein [Bradyrhizobium sp.]MBI5264018.1 DUF3551 domain-containing protein [Bradyrhizobium sp.]
MRKILSLAAVVASATFLGVAQPAVAKDYQYCRQDAFSAGVRDCSFDTLQQCRATAAGRGGECARNPASEATGSYAYAKGRIRHK